MSALIAEIKTRLPKATRGRQCKAGGCKLKLPFEGESRRSSRRARWGGRSPCGSPGRWGDRGVSAPIL